MLNKMEEKELYEYARLALAGKDIDSVIDDNFRNALFQYFYSKGYDDQKIDELQYKMTEFVHTFKQTAIKTPTLDQLEDFIHFYTTKTDRSNDYIEGIYDGELRFEDSFAQDAMYEDEDIRITHLGTLYYDNDQEFIEKYRVVRFAKEGAPVTVFECYSEINAVEMVDDEEYRRMVVEQLKKGNVQAINCKGYIGTVIKDQETGEYEVDFDKTALSAVVDYEKDKGSRGGESR